MKTRRDFLRSTVLGASAAWTVPMFIDRTFGQLHEGARDLAIQPDGTAAEAERYTWGKRVREVEEAPDGSVYVLEDDDGARLLRLTQAR